jgi:hypothetical protein
MQKEELLELYDLELRIEVTIPGVQKETFPGLVRFTRPVSGMNFVLYSRLPLRDLDKVIKEQITYFAAITQPFTWHVFEHDRPPELAGRLTAHGFQKDEEPDIVLIYDLTRAPFSSDLPSGMVIRRLSSADQLVEVASIEQSCLGSDFRWLIPRLLLQMGEPGYLSIYMAYVEERPVSAGWIIYPPGSQFACLYGGATLPEFRGRGIYSSVLSARLKETVQRGRRYAVVGAGEMSRPILLMCGFRPLTTSYDYILKK